MIIIIILIVLCILSGLCFLMAYIKRDWLGWEENWFLTGLAGGLGFGIGLITCSIMCIVANSTTFKENKRISLNETIVEIMNTRYVLEHRAETETVTVLEINTYNEKVRNFKNEIKKNQAMLKDPWVNWFVCPVYNEYDPDVVSYL